MREALRAGGRADGPDLLVAGAGGGLVAALRAAQHGLDVLVVEASEHFRRGNNTSMSTAMVPGTGTRWQRAAGVEDSPERFVTDVLAKTKGSGDARLAAALAGVSAPMLEWLADDVGVPLSLVTDFRYPGHSVDRCHTVDGRHGSVLLDRLVAAVKASSRIDLLIPARLVDVLVDDDDVAAAVVEQPDGSREEIPASAVLLATNGYGADRDLVARHLPEIASAVYHGSETSRGDALRIGARLGAATASMDSYQGHAALAQRSASLVGWATVMHGGIMLDLTGRRYGDETTGYSEYAAALASRPGATGWLVLDQRVANACTSFTDFNQTVAAGALVWASDAAELAEVTGLPAAEVGNELAETARVAVSGGPDRFGRTHFDAPLAPPYATVKVVPALFHTQGGLVVDGRARVLTGAGTPIAGLYASGGAAAGISGHGAAGYLAGNGLLPALGLALLAADHVAERCDPENASSPRTSQEGPR